MRMNWERSLSFRSTRREDTHNTVQVDANPTANTPKETVSG